MMDIVSTEWLAKEIDDDTLCIVDASQHDFEPERNPANEYEAGHIPGAVYLDLNSLFDESSTIPNMMPSEALFTDRMQELGVDSTKRIVIYDDSVLKSGLRAWYMFRIFGLKNVAYLDGGLAKWKKEGQQVVSAVTAPMKSNWLATLSPENLEDKESVYANLSSLEKVLVDGRGSEHFSGTDDDPNPSVASGHIPGAINVPFWDLFDEDGTFKTPNTLQLLFKSAGVDFEKPAIASCGAGVVACALIMAMRLCGKSDTTLYDGSWSEWGAIKSLPKSKGAA